MKTSKNLQITLLEVINGQYVLNQVCSF